MSRKIVSLQISSVIMGIIAIIAFVTVYSLISAFNLVNHTHDVIYSVRHIKDDISDCQTSMRETVFAEDKKYLTLYLNKIPGIEAGIDRLQWLTRDNEAQQQNVYELRQNIGRRIEAFRETLELVNKGDFENAKKLSKQRFGESWIISTRNLVEIIESEEKRLLDLRLLDYKQKSQLVLYGIPVLMIIYIVVFNFITGSFKNELGV